MTSGVANRLAQRQRFGWRFAEHRSENEKRAGGFPTVNRTQRSIREGLAGERLGVLPSLRSGQVEALWNGSPTWVRLRAVTDSFRYVLRVSRYDPSAGLSRVLFSDLLAEEVRVINPIRSVCQAARID
jgi:hypothetical protein